MPSLILLVDDSKVVRQIVRTYLETHLEHVAIMEASDGLDAICHTRKDTPDVIVLDVSMPVMNGLEAAPVLHGIAPHALIILFTLHKDVVSEKQARAAGIGAVVSKTDQIDVLVDYILNLTDICAAPHLA